MGFFDNVGTIFDFVINPEEYKDLGAGGERRTYRKLTEIYFKSQIFRNVYLKKEDGSYTEIDLVTVGSKGIFVFESKNYSGWIFGNDKQQNWMQTMPNGFKNKFLNPVWQNSGHIKCLKHNLQQYPNIVYRSVIVFSERCELKKIECDTPDTYIIKRDALENTVNKILKNSQKVLSESEVEEIKQFLSKAQRPNSEVRERHLEDIQEGLTKCPKCKSDLVEKKNKETGEAFYGCKAFPKCRYITKNPKQIEAVLSKVQQTAVDEPPPIEEQPKEEPTQTAKCPKCGNDVVERKNKNTGEVFYGCKAFPKCRYTAKELSQ